MYVSDQSSRCAQQSRLGERPFSTIMLQGQLPNLRVQSLEIQGLRWWFRPAKDVRSPGQQLLLPFGNLGGIHLNQPDFEATCFNASLVVH